VVYFSSSEPVGGRVLSVFEGNRLVPHIKVVGRNVYCGDLLIPTDRKPLTLDLFMAFIEQPVGLSTLSLMRRIYCSEYSSDMSRQYKNTLKHNVIKLISRSRNLADEACYNSSYEGIEWFSFNKYTSEWSLLAFRTKYLLKCEELIKSNDW